VQNSHVSWKGENNVSPEISEGICLVRTPTGSNPHAEAPEDAKEAIQRFNAFNAVLRHNTEVEFKVTRDRVRG
jgi:hypothetical protein